MNVGHYISGLGHIVLLSWAFLGNLFEQDYKSVEIVKISVISSEQYADSVLSDEAPLIASQIENLSSPIVQGQNLPDTTGDIEKVEISKIPEKVVELNPYVEKPETQTTMEMPKPILGDYVTYLKTSGTEESESPPSEILSNLPSPAGGSRSLPKFSNLPEPNFDDSIDTLVPEDIIDSPKSPELSKKTEINKKLETIKTKPEESQIEPKSEEILQNVGRPRTRPNLELASKEKEPEKNIENEELEAKEAIDAILGSVLQDDEVSIEVSSNERPEKNDEIVYLSEAEKMKIESRLQPLFQKRLKKYWVRDLTARSDRLDIRICLQMNEDKTILKSSIKMDHYEGGSFADAEAAFQRMRRGLIMGEKNGYDIPADIKYYYWKDICFNFEPSKLSR